MTRPIDVVAAAIIRDGRVLAAHRSSTPIGWEFPGGKVERGESHQDALVREIREELGVDVAVGDELGRATGRGRAGDLVLTLFACALDCGEPRAGTDHDELRWTAADGLAGLAWLLLDTPLVDAVRDRLAGS